MVEQIFFSPQVKRSVIISNKCGIYEVPNELGVRILGNWEISGKSQLCPSAQSSSLNQNFVKTSKKQLKNRN